MKMPRMRIALGLGLVAASVLAMVATQNPLTARQRPAPPEIGDFDFYGNATPSEDLKLRVGPNTFTVASVVRNDRDGSLRFEDGRGRKMAPRPTPETADLKMSGPWLDAAIINLAGDPSRIEVIDLRVFDHATRAFIGNSTDFNHGSAVVAPGVYQIARVGAPLPDEVDVWFRASSHPPGEAIGRLPAKVGASVAYRAGTLAIAEIREGHPGWTEQASSKALRPTIVWKPANRERMHQCSAVIDWTGEPDDTRTQIVAVAHDGRRDHQDQPHGFDFLHTERQVFTFHFDPDEIDHFEIRPVTALQNFYFEGVRLPPASPKRFAPAPEVAVKLEGQPMRQRIKEFNPLSITLEIRGDEGGYLSGSDNHGVYLAVRPEKRPVGAFNVILDTIGLMPDRWRLTILHRNGKPYDFDILDSHYSGMASGSIHRGVWGIDFPLARIDAIQITLPE